MYRLRWYSVNGTYWNSNIRSLDGILDHLASWTAYKIEYAEAYEDGKIVYRCYNV